MINRRFAVLSFAALMLGMLLVPATASAQGSIWDRMRDRARQDRRDDDYGRRSGRISDHERRVLRDAARRIESRSKNFERNLDRLLDNSRYNNSRREDSINADARQFRDAARRFKDRAGDSNDLYRSSNEARQLIDMASRIEQGLRRVRLDSRTSNDWSQIRSDLRTVADIYGIRYYDSGYYGRGNDRRDRDYRYPY